MALHNSSYVETSTVLHYVPANTAYCAARIEYFLRRATLLSPRRHTRRAPAIPLPPPSPLPRWACMDCFGSFLGCDIKTSAASAARHWTSSAAARSTWTRARGSTSARRGTRTRTSVQCRPLLARRRRVPASDHLPQPCVQMGHDARVCRACPRLLRT